MSGFLLSSTTSPSGSQPGSRSASRSRTYGTNPNEPVIVNDTAGVNTISPPSTSNPQSRSESPARVGRSDKVKESSSRSSSRQRITNAVKSVFGSHGHDMNFADNKGLERQAREASASRSRNASRAGSRSGSRAPSPSRAAIPEEGANVPTSSSRSSSRSRIGQAVYKALGGHEHHLQFADERGLQRQARDAERSSSKPSSRSASRSASRVRGEPITEEAENRGRANAEYSAVRA